MSGAAKLSMRVDHFGVTFTAPGEFEASNDAEALLKKAGFSIGSSQRGSPTAVMFGDYVVAKWRNLNHDERRETHATLTGDHRSGPVTFRFLPAAPDEAVEAFAAAIESARSADPEPPLPDSQLANGGVCT